MGEHHARVYTLVERAAIEQELTILRELHAVTVLERLLWGIGDSRALVQEVYKTQSDGRTRAFALICGDITLEAQNALLKIVEEPPAHSRLIFFLAPEANLLPTLRSRVQMVVSNVVASGSPPPAFMQWKELSLSEQIGAIETRLKKKDEVWMEAVVRGARTFLGEHYRSFPQSTAERLYYALEHVGTRGASNKMLLEEIALLFSSVAKKR